MPDAAPSTEPTHRLEPPATSTNAGAGTDRAAIDARDYVRDDDPTPAPIVADPAMLSPLTPFWPV